ncbi:hypothetical protein [Halodesulfovibrio aestuarii]|uniref:Transcriptional regulator n=1 Tax=Halodesulfovibrio aestuarii TaxID=126333 RepID=A0ABV4JTW7_9BACT
MSQHVQSIPELVADLSRTEKLEIFLSRTNNSYAALGRKLNINRSHVRGLLVSDDISTNYFAKFLAVGLPGELLPRPVLRKRGRPKKTTPSDTAH